MAELVQQLEALVAQHGRAGAVVLLVEAGGQALQRRRQPVGVGQLDAQVEALLDERPGPVEVAGPPGQVTPVLQQPGHALEVAQAPEPGQALVQRR